VVAKSHGTRYQYQTLFGAAEPGANPNDHAQIVAGTRFRFNANGRILGIRYFRDWHDGGDHWGVLMPTPYSAIITRSVLFPIHEAETGEEPGNWESAYFSKMVPVENGAEYTVAVYWSAGNYWRVSAGLSGAPVISGDIEAIEDGDGGDNGVYQYGSDIYLGNTYASTLVGVDPIFLADTEVAG